MTATATATADAPTTRSMADELTEYLAKHRIKERLEEAMNAAVKARPDDPMRAIAAALMAAAPPAPTGAPPAEATETTATPTGKEFAQLVETLHENRERGFDPADHTEEEVLALVEDAKRVVACGTALAAKAKSAEGGGERVEPMRRRWWRRRTMATRRRCAGS